MKKYVAVLLAAFLVFALAACVGENKNENAPGEKQLSIVCTTFPIYDWAKNILGDKADSAKLTLLLDNGVDLHNYQATAEDIVTIHNADVFIYIGGTSDDWVADVVSEAQNENLISVNLMASLNEKAKVEEKVEGMEAEEEEEEEEFDEHIWLSIENAEDFVEKIADAFCSADSDNAAAYEANADAYIEDLDALDEKYERTVDAAKFDTLLFGDRFPFRYLVDDYELNYYAAFPGCSAETEASFETVTFLANKVDELGLPAVLTIEGGDGKIAETIVKTAKSEPEILTLNSMQSLGSKDFDAGISYISVMENNLDILAKAIGQ